MMVEKYRLFLLQNFPEAVGGMLCGSHARGAATATSDVDLIVILKEVFENYHYLTFRHEGKLTEVSVFSSETLVKAIEEQATVRNNAYLKMFEEGIVLFDYTGNLADAQRLAPYYIRHYLPDPAARLLGRLHRMYTAALKGLKRPDSSTSLAHVLAFQIAQMATLKMRTYERPEFELIEVMAEEGPEKERTLLKQYLSLTAKERPVFFKNILDYLKPLEPFFITYSTGPVYNCTIDNRLSLILPKDDEKARKTKECIALALEQLPELSCYPFYNHALPVLNLKGTWEALLQLKHHLEAETGQMDDFWTHLPYYPIHFAEETFHALEMYVVEAHQLFSEDDRTDEVVMALATVVLLTTLRLVPDEQQELILINCKERVLTRTLPLFRGKKGEDIAEAEKQHLAVSTTFAEENAAFFEMLQQDLEEPLRGIGVNWQRLITMHEELQDAAIALEAVLYFWATLPLGAEEQLLLVYGVERLMQRPAAAKQ